MKILFNKLLLSTLLACISQVTFAADEIKPVTWKGYALAEDVSNLRGGIKDGSVYTLAGHLAALIDTKAMNWWSGGQFTFGVLGIGQNHNQALYTGAIQTPSNFSGVPEVKISDLAYQQKFNAAFTARIGIMDIDDQFNVTEVAANILNSDLDNTVSLSSSTQLATYPFPGIGLELEYDAGDWELQAAIFQGDPRHQSTVFHHGYLLIAEGKYTKQTKCRNAAAYTFKLGIWDYQQPLETIGQDDYGMYAIAEVTWISHRGPKFGAAIQGGINQYKSDTVPYSFAACFTITNMFKCRPDDCLNFAYGQAWSQGVPSEKVFEIGYVIQIIKNLTLTPDVQYFIKPSGVYPNAWVALARLNYTIG